MMKLLNHLGMRRLFKIHRKRVTDKALESIERILEAYVAALANAAKESNRKTVLPRDVQLTFIIEHQKKNENKSRHKGM